MSIIPDWTINEWKTIMGIIVLAFVFLVLLALFLSRKSRKKEDQETIDRDAEIISYSFSGQHEEKPKKKSIKKRAEKIIKDENEIKKIVREEDIQEAKKGFDPVKARSRFSMRFWKDHFKEKFWPERTILINMELNNGFHKLFMVKEKDSGFRYLQKKYIFDNECKYYILDSKLWCYDFHESYSLPIKRKIPIQSVRDTLEHSQISEVEYASNPSTLERFAISKIAEGIMKGQALDDFFKQIRLLLIITMVAGVIHLILFMFKTGMLQQIKVPGIS